MQRALTRICTIVLSLAAALAAPARAQPSSNGLIMLLEFERIEGLRHWEQELNKRGLNALVQVQHNILEQYPKDLARMAAESYVIAGTDAEKAVLGYAL